MELIQKFIHYCQTTVFLRPSLKVGDKIIKYIFSTRMFNMRAKKWKYQNVFIYLVIFGGEKEKKKKPERTKKKKKRKKSEAQNFFAHS